MKFAHVLPDPASYPDWSEFEGDLASMRQAGYDAVELQIADPRTFDEARAGQSLWAVGYGLCAFQTGSTYVTRGNCLCTADAVVRRRTTDLIRSFVDLAARWNAVMVFGSLQGRLKDEPDRAAGEARIREAIHEVGQYATARGATVAFEPVNHSEVGFHNTIAEAAGLVRSLGLPGGQDDGGHFSHEYRGEGHVGASGGNRRHPCPRPSLGDQPRRAGQRPLGHAGVS